VDAHSRVAVAVVDVRVVGVGVGERLVLVRMSMGFPGVHAWFVRVPVMLVVKVGVAVDDPIVRVFVCVLFGEVKPDPDRHECRGRVEQGASRLPKDEDRDRGADERS
jgi:hypothetical protein